MTTISGPVPATVDLGGVTHYLDFGGPSDGPLVVCVHGLGGAAWNWLAFGPLLTRHARVLALDLAGHGLTPAAGRSTTVGAHVRLLDRFIREVAAEPVVLVGNSMGGLITMLESAASPDVVRAAVLVDPALPRPAFSPVNTRVTAQFAVGAAPIIGATIYARRRHRLPGEQIVRMGLSICTVDIDRVPGHVFTAAAEMMRTRDRARFPASDVLASARSTMRRVVRASELRQTMAMITPPVLLIHGDKDRLIPFAAARRSAQMFPDWRFEIARDVGHVPMLEAADWTADVVLDWMRAEAGVLA